MHAATGIPFSTVQKHARLLGYSPPVRGAKLVMVDDLRLPILAITSRQKHPSWSLLEVLPTRVGVILDAKDPHDLRWCPAIANQEAISQAPSADLHNARPLLPEAV